MNKLLRMTLVAALVACGSESVGGNDAPDRVAPELASASFDSDPMGLARMLAGLQRELFRKLGDPAQDPAPLLMREFMLFDGADSLSWRYGGSFARFSRQDDYLRILAGRLPPDELRSDSLEVHRLMNGRVVVVSHLADGRVNLTTWVKVGEAWKARAITLNPRAADLDRIARYSRPLLAR
jgi:hypothetical protein